MTKVIYEISLTSYHFLPRSLNTLFSNMFKNISKESKK
jgi:hypothetical protein